MLFLFKLGQVSILCGYYFKYKNDCVLKWILRKRKIMGESIQNGNFESCDLHRELEREIKELQHVLYVQAWTGFNSMWLLFDLILHKDGCAARRCC